MSHFTTLEGTDPREPEKARKKRKDPWNKHPDIALIASNSGAGCILVSDGAAIEYSQENGYRLDDNGLDDAPDGLSIWEGCGHTSEWSTDMGREYDFELCGTFRDLTDREWALFRETGTPWEYETSGAEAREWDGVMRYPNGDPVFPNEE